MGEGTPIVYTIFQDEGSFDITNYWLSTATHEECLRAAGLRDVRWHAPRLSPEGRAAGADDFWAPFLTHPPITFLECVR
jgi:toxoflavin synthase